MLEDLHGRPHDRVLPGQPQRRHVAVRAAGRLADERAELIAGPVRLTQRAEVTDGVLYWKRELTVDTARIPPEAWSGVRPLLTSASARSEARISFVVP